MRRKLIGLIFLCLAVRVVMPAGYMPAPIGAGGPFVLCPGGMSGASLVLAAQAHAAGDHGNAHGHTSDEASHFWESCPFDAAFGTAVIVNEVELVLPRFDDGAVPTGSSLPVPGTTSHPFRARAPPLLTSRYV